MRAIVSERHGPNSVVMKDVQKPEVIQPGHVLLRMRAVGVCGSDIHIYNGDETYQRKSPVTLGHEMTGVVEDTGSGVSVFEKGDRVVSETAYNVCGKCFNCRTGNYNLCPDRIGFGALADGGMAEFLVVREDILHHVPDGVDDVTAALTEPTCVAFNAASTLGEIKPADTVLIIGPGPIGLMSLQVALLHSPYNVSILGTASDGARLELARSLGADDIFTSPGSAAEKLKSVGWAGGADVVIDAAGVSSTLKIALGAVRHGGRIVKVGWGPDKPDFSLDPIVGKAVDLQGSFSHNWATWERVLRLFAKGKLRPAEIASTYQMADWKTSFEEMRSLKIAKGVLLI